MGAGDIDISRAISLYRKSCSMGSATGCFYLAQSYKYGHGAPESKIDYNKYMEKSKELDPEVYRRLSSQLQDYYWYMIDKGELWVFTVQNLEKETKRDDSYELSRFFVLEVSLFSFLNGRKIKWD